MRLWKKSSQSLASVAAVWLPVWVFAASVSAAGADLRLLEAVKNQDAASVRALLKQRVDVNAREGDGATALHWAVIRDNAEVVDALLRSGADVNAANDYGVTAVSLACVNRNAPMVKTLLARGANPSAATSMGETLLMTCAGTGSEDAVAALFDHGASNVNAKETSYGQTALRMAAAQANPQMVRLLLMHGADIRARSTGYSLPVSLGSRDVERGRGAVMMPQRGSTPLLLAARHGRIENARLLLEAGADVNEAAPTGESALVVASFSDQGAFARLLLERGANLNDAAAGYTALHAAVVRGDVELVKALAARGADLNVRLTKGSPDRRQAYWFALSGAWAGATPFWMAAKFAEVEIMRALVSAGADPNIPANDSSTPLMALAGMGYRPSSVGLNRRDQGIGPDASRLLQAASEKPTYEGTKLLIELGVNLNATNSQGDTAAHAAAQNEWASVVKLLGEHGAKLDIKNKAGRTVKEMMGRDSGSNC